MNQALPPSAAPIDRVSRKLAALAPSVTLQVDARAKELKAAGRPVISYAAGEPDFATPQFIVDAAAVALQDPANYRYTPAAGLPALRSAIAEVTERDSGLSVEPSQVLVTNGGKQAVYQAFQAVVNPGDEVLLPAPYWTTYPEAIRLADGVPVEVFAGADQSYKVTVEQLEAARTDRTTALVFVSPSNPTGSVYTPEETRAIGEWALENGIWVISDEIYQHLVYDDVRAVSIVEAVPAGEPDPAAERCREDLRDGRLAGRLDGRSRRGDQARGEPAVAPQQQRQQRRPARRAGGADRSARRDRGVPAGLRPAPAPDRRGASEDPRGRGPDAARCVLRLPGRPGAARPGVARADPADLARAGRPHARRDRGRGRPG